MPAWHREHLRISHKQGIARAPIDSQRAPPRERDPNGNQNKDVNKGDDGSHGGHQNQWRQETLTGDPFPPGPNRRRPGAGNLQVCRGHEWSKAPANFEVRGDSFAKKLADGASAPPACLPEVIYLFDLRLFRSLHESVGEIIDILVYDKGGDSIVQSLLKGRWGCFPVDATGDERPVRK